jgi:hypothetical protein
VRVEVIEWRSLRGREIQAGDHTYLCDINYPVIASRNNPASPRRRPDARRESSCEIRDLELARRHFIQICRIFAPQYPEKFHSGTQTTLDFVP